MQCEGAIENLSPQPRKPISMSRRTISVTQIQVHRRYKTADLCDVAALPDGADLLHLFHGLVKDADPKHLVDEDAERYNSVETISPQGRTLTLELAVGRFGDQGWNRNVTTHTITHQHGADEAHTVATRAMLVVPKSGTSALLFIEHASNIGGGTALLRLLGRLGSLDIRTGRSRPAAWLRPMPGWNWRGWSRSRRSSTAGTATQPMQDNPRL